jgi:SHS2 domain-containing protein
MNIDQAGFRELEHTADWELHVWASDLDALFEQAALGMMNLSGTRLQQSPRVKRTLKLSGEDPETLLVTFLSELLYFGEQDQLGFDKIDVRVMDEHLSANLEGALLASQEKEIKAVTYHNLKIRPNLDGYQVNIVFDV